MLFFTDTKAWEWTSAGLTTPTKRTAAPLSQAGYPCRSATVPAALIAAHPPTILTNAWGSTQSDQPKPTTASGSPVTASRQGA